MAFAPTPGDLVRAAGGLAYVAMGAYVLLHKPRTPRAADLGGILVPLGVALVVVNLFNQPEYLVVGSWFYIVSAVPLAFFGARLVLREAGPRRKDAWLALAASWTLGAAAGTALTGAAAYLAGNIPAALDLAQSIATTVSITTFAAIAWALAWSADAAGTRHGYAGAAALATGLALWPLQFASLIAPAEAVVPGAYDRAALGALLTTLPFLPALVAWSRSGTAADARPRRILLATLVGVPVAFNLLIPFAQIGTIAYAFVDASYGISRFLGLGFIAYAAFKLDAFGWDRSEKKDRRAFLATGALAVLFMVAQVAENLFDDTYGLLTGGVVAGAFLIAARPIERALERGFLGGRAATVGAADMATITPTHTSRSHADHEAVYVKALRIALKDRVLTPEEAVHLHELAESLGIGAGRAHALYVKVAEGRKE